MASITESLEELTEALQKLAAESRASERTPFAALPESSLPGDALVFPNEVEKFVRDSQEYSDKTRQVSIGVY